MQDLSMAQLVLVSGGISEKTMTSVEGGLFGVTEGAILCGVVFGLPLWAFATSNGVNVSSQALGVFLFVSSTAAGGLLGGILGTCTGYAIACANAHEPSS